MAGIIRDMESLFRQENKIYFPLRIGMCNGHEPYLFSNAYLEYPQFKDEENDIAAVELETLLSTAFSTLRPDDVNGIRIGRLLSVTDHVFEEQKKALKCLTDFLQDYKKHEDSLKKVRRNKQTSIAEICGVLTIHLFSKLVDSEDVVISKVLKSQKDVCPCGCGSRLVTGNTGIGNPKTWHGHPDLLVNQTSITVKASSVYSGEENSVLKEKDTSIYGLQFSAQITSQAITNGFAQKTKTDRVNTLVPSIGCTLNEMLIFLYDPDQDILLRRQQHVLIMDKDDHIIIPVVVELWLILNVHVFGPIMPQSVCRILGKSGIRGFFEDRSVLKHYYDTLVGVEDGELYQEVKFDLSPNELFSKNVFHRIEQNMT